MRTVTPLATALAALALAVVPGAARAAEPPNCDALAGGTVNAIDAVPWAQIPEAGSLTAVAGGAGRAAAGAGRAARRARELQPALPVRHARRADLRRRAAPGAGDGRLARDAAAGLLRRPRRDASPPTTTSWSRSTATAASSRWTTRSRARTSSTGRKRWGPPLWEGPGRKLPGRVIAWAWSVLSPAEDKTWTDVGGTRHPVGERKVSHIWALRDGGRRMTFMDPWLPDDDSYEMCGPYRSRFRAVNLSASGSQIFVIGAHGDLFTRLYDFDLAGHDEVFMSYAYARSASRSTASRRSSCRRRRGCASRRSRARSRARSRSRRRASARTTRSCASRAARRPQRLLGEAPAGALAARRGDSTATTARCGAERSTTRSATARAARPRRARRGRPLRAARRALRVARRRLQRPLHARDADRRRRPRAGRAAAPQRRRAAPGRAAPRPRREPARAVRDDRGAAGACAPAPRRCRRRCARCCAARSAPATRSSRATATTSALTLAGGGLEWELTR